MATRLQEARARLREAEAAALAVTAKHAEQDKAIGPAKARLERIEKTHQRSPIVVQVTGGYTVRYGGVVSFDGYGWSRELGVMAEGKTGKSAQEAVATAILNGLVGINFNNAVSKCRGIAKRTRYLRPDDVRKVKAAHARVTAAEAKLNKAKTEQREAIEVGFTSGSTIDAPVLASMLAEHFLVAQKARVVNPWGRDREIGDARKVTEAAQAHLRNVPSKSKDPCPCVTCEGERREAEWAARAAESDKAKAKAAAARQKIIDRARWVTFTCPSCMVEGCAPVLAPTGWNGEVGKPSVRCTEARCGRTTPVAALRSKPAKKPVAAA